MAQKVYKGHNSPFTVRIKKPNGAFYSATEMASISRVYLKYIPEDGSDAEYADSNDTPSYFDWSTYASDGLLLIDIGLIDFTVGRDTKAEIIVYDSTWPQGRVVSQEDITISDDALGDIELADALTVISSGDTASAYTLDLSLSTDHSYSGPTSTDTVGESVVFGDFLYRNTTDEKWYKAQANAITTIPVLRMAVMSADADASCLMLCSGGVARDDSWNWTDDGTVLALVVSASVVGDLVEDQYVDTSSGCFGQAVATPIASNQIELNPSLDIARY